jgi:hypothetical protein
MTLADRSVVAVGVTDAGDQACLLTDWAPKVCDPLPTPVSPVTIPFAHVFESTLGQPQRHVIWGVIQSGFTAVLVSNGVQTPVVRSPRSGNGLSGFAQTVSAAGPGAHLEIRDSNGTVVQTTALAATPTTSAASPTTAGAGPGAPVAIGDLVMLGARSRLEALGIKVDASANRRPQDFVAELDALRSANAIGDTVVIQVGLNGAITNDELDQIVAAIPQSQTPNLVFMTVQAPAAWIEGNNERIKALPSRYPWVKILDWATLSANVALCPDGIHLSCNGPAPAEYYANAVLNAIRSAGRPQPSS